MTWVLARVASDGEVREGSASGSPAKRSMGAAAARHMISRVLAGGTEEPREIVGQQLRDRVKRAQIQYSYTTTQDEGGTGKTASDGSGNVRDHSESQLVIAAKMVAAD